MSYKNISFNISDSIAVIKLDRPTAGNTFNIDLANELEEISQICLESKEIRAVLLSANGKLFSGGGDLGYMMEQGDDIAASIKELATRSHAAFVNFARMRAPLVVAVNGTAAGIGLSLSLIGDYTIAAEEASFVMAYMGVGLSPDGGASYLLPRLVGLKKAKDLILLNRKLSAQEAEEWGLINKVTSQSDLEEESLKVAKKLANGPTVAIGAAKSLLNQYYKDELEFHMGLEADEISKCASSEDGQEGINAFLGKRKPGFSGQ